MIQRTRVKDFLKIFLELIPSCWFPVETLQRKIGIEEQHFKR